ncbi:zinc finger ccch-type-containing 11a [Anaeramoeba ignava]|uniref:Zinc finger ccch-type-containing 11a n=1 Tax=Anaeramoeba ignava TaxID=1746090 RepID=A0A9Q0LIA2_ANAIG|nr:zinc finger ccch-type-containing 11a [Anaeramoeba ignava]
MDSNTEKINKKKNPPKKKQKEKEKKQKEKEKEKEKNIENKEMNIPSQSLKDNALKRNNSESNEMLNQSGKIFPHSADTTAVMRIGTKSIVYDVNDPRLRTVPCKYWIKGTCKLGDKCRFLHGTQRSEDPRRPEYHKLPKIKSSPNLQKQQEDAAEEEKRQQEQMESQNITKESNIESIQSIPPQNFQIHLNEYEPFMLTSSLSYQENVFRYGRHPYLHIAVLFSNDSKVRHYSYEIRNKFVVNGIDTYLQTEIEPSGCK